MSETTTAESAERRVRRRQSRRELIVLAAVEVFREMGLEKATLEAVGERVGLSKASLYYYVRSKEELLGHVVVHVVRAQEEALARVLDAGGPEERLRAFCHSHVRIICTDPVGRVSAQVALSGIRDDVVRRPLHEYMSRLESILRDGVAAGRVEPVVDPGRWVQASGAFRNQWPADQEEPSMIVAQGIWRLGVAAVPSTLWPACSDW